MNLHHPQIINLPKFLDKRGNLSIVEEFKQIPFKIERAYWIYDVQTIITKKKKECIDCLGYHLLF